MIAGTIFASTKVPLCTWFRAMYDLTQSKGGISGIELGRPLGLTQTTAWKIKHKLMQVMMERDATKRLAGRIEIDDAYAAMAAAGGEMALIVSSVLIGIALACTASSLALAACARAVPEQSRSKMLGVVAAVGSFGTLIVPLATQGVLKYYPWQIGALFFAVLAAAMLPAAFWAGASDKLPVMTAAAKTTMRDTLAQALRHRGFLVMSGAYFVCGLNLVFLTTHLPAYLEICGQDAMLSAEALAVIGAVNCVGALLAGWLGGRYPKHVVLGWLYILRSVAFAAYFVAPPTASNTLIFAAAMGLLWFPGVWPLLSGLVAEMFGTRYIGMLTVCLVQRIDRMAPPASCRANP